MEADDYHHNKNQLEGTEDSVTDDDSLSDDFETVDMAEVNRALDRRNVKRRSCFAHSLQLTVKDTMDTCTSARLNQAKYSKIAICDTKVQS